MEYKEIDRDIESLKKEIQRIEKEIKNKTITKELLNKILDQAFKVRDARMYEDVREATKGMPPLIRQLTDHLEAQMDEGYGEGED